MDGHNEKFDATPIGRSVSACQRCWIRKHSATKSSLRLELAKRPKLHKPSGGPEDSCGGGIKTIRIRIRA